MASYVGNVVSGGNTNLVASTFYGTCSTASNTAAKVVTLTNCDALLTGMTVHVKFQYTNTAADPTLNINGTGAYPIYTSGTVYPGNTALTSWKANAMVSLTFDGTAWRMNDNTSYDDVRTNILNLVYPVGAIYMSVNSTSPATLFGGTWAQIKDTFLLAAGTSHAAGSTGGAETVTLTTNNLPSHKHTVGAHAHGLNSHVHSVGAHSHGLNSHTHTMAHTHGLNSHTHTMAHTHGLNDHVHSLNSHVHGLNSHTHGMSHTHSLSSHTHSFSGSGSTSANGSHSHEIFTQGSSGETWGYTWASGASYATADGIYSVGNHTHTVSVSGSTGGPSTDSTGSSSISSTGGASGNTAAASGNTGAASGNTAASSAANTGAASGSTAASSAANTGAAGGSTANSTAFNTGAASGNTANSSAFDSGATGSGTAVDKMPPYLSVYVWKRTA